MTILFHYLFKTKIKDGGKSYHNLVRKKDDETSSQGFGTIPSPTPNSNSPINSFLNLFDNCKKKRDY